MSPTKKTLLSLIRGYIYMKDEINFRFLVFVRYGRSKCNQLAKKNKIVSQKMHNVLKRIFCSAIFFVMMFSFWDMVDFFLVNIHSVLISDLDEFRHFIMFGGLRPITPDAFGLNPSSQLVNYWLAFLNQVRKIPRSQGKILQSSRPIGTLRMISTKSTISQNLKIITKKA